MEESGMERVKPEGGKADKNALKEKITDLWRGLGESR